MGRGMSGPHNRPGDARRGRARILACALVAAALVLLPAAAGADSRKRPYRPTGRDRSLVAADALGRDFFSERRRKAAARTQRLNQQKPARVSDLERDVEDWLSRWGAVDFRETR